MKLILLLSIVFVLGPTPAFADGVPNHNVPKMQVIPHCTLQQVGNTLLCTYDLETWKKVLAADVELVHLRVQLKNEEARTASLAEQVMLLTSQGRLYTTSQGLLIARVDRLTEDLIAMNLKYEKESAKSRLGSPVAWTIAAVSASVLVGFVIKDFAD